MAIFLIQIQPLLKLNPRKINLYDFYYTIKSKDLIKMLNFQGLRRFFLILADKNKEICIAY